MQGGYTHTHRFQTGKREKLSKHLWIINAGYTFRGRGMRNEIITVKVLLLII